MTLGKRYLRFLIFDRRPPLWYKFFSLPSVLLPLKSGVAAIIFFKKIPSTRSPKLRLLCRLQESCRKRNNLYKNINNLHKE